MALRLAELLSLLEYKNIVFGTGDGVKLKGNWIRALNKMHQKRAAAIDDDMEVVWARFWGTKGRGRTRYPFDLRWGTDRLPSGLWEQAMATWHASELQSFHDGGRSRRNVQRIGAKPGGAAARMRRRKAAVR
jgi:hypothetical protein